MSCELTLEKLPQKYYVFITSSPFFFKRTALFVCTAELYSNCHNLLINFDYFNETLMLSVFYNPLVKLFQDCQLIFSVLLEIFFVGVTDSNHKLVNDKF